MDDPLIGHQLANFRVERVLGQGGMAQVYYGWDVKLERPVAIKVIDARYRSNPAYAERFVREAQTVSTWRHENIVQIYYADDQDGLYYFAMEYIEGEDLGALMRRYAEHDTLLAYEEVLRIGAAIARALDYAHRQGVVHRDVKPSNVMIEHGGRVILTDFGLVMDVQQGSLGEVLGSPNYIAPEQARRSSDAVSQSDLYSLGIVLYEMLTGQVPFDDPSPASLALQHLTLSPPPPRELNPDLSVEVEAVLLKALAKSPADRYQTGAELIGALTHALAKEGVPAPLPAAAELETQGHRYASQPTVPDRRAFPWWAVGIGGALLVVVIAAVLLLSQGGGAAEAEVVPTASVTPTAEAEETEAAVTSAESVAALPTSAPTELPTTTPSPAEEQPSPIATETAPAPPAAGNPTATVLYPDGYRVILLYNERAFYLWNVGDRRLEAASVAFEALDADGQPTDYHFDGSSWATYSAQLMEGRCNAIEVVSPTAIARPAECTRFNATRSPVDGSPWIFWQERGGITQFRMLWNDQEVARCDVSADMCEVFLP